MGNGCKCGCATFREHALGVTFSGAAMPTRKPTVVDATQRERRWDRDMPAYKRLKQDGLQPKRIDGSADMETRAVDSVEITDGHIYGKHVSLARDTKEVVKESRSA